jgi:tRNA (mo5U34)-methyltransferase
MLSHYQSLLHFLTHSRLRFWADQLRADIEKGLSTQRYGDLPKWQQALENLPEITASRTELNKDVIIGDAMEISASVQAEIKQQLQTLIPWRKGPFTLFGIHVDTEWRSDWKWQRVLPHLKPLEHRMILDVGCGNGYHCLRMAGAGAKRVIGIDPSPRFTVQFLMLKKYLGDIAVDVLPIGIESLPQELAAFDTTFSMGVLYHRRSPMDHLRELKATLKPGGELVLETLIIEGEDGECLVPEDRYAMMRNVWFLPSALTLISWLKKCGFKNPRLVDTNVTSLEEQRATDWMQFQSLSDFLDANDPNKTVEGHPAPVRGVFIAEN